MDAEVIDWRTRELAMRLRVLKTQLASVKEDNRAVRELCETTKESIRLTKDDKLKKQKANLEHWLTEKRIRLNSLKQDLKLIKSQTMSRSKNMLLELCDIYPIIEFPDRKGYSICDIHLPNKDNFEGHDETMISVAFGYVCHLLLLISEFLDISMRFPLKYFGSKSTIFCNGNNQSFPLYIESFKNKEWPNFLYGVRLLNLDILQIRTLCGLSTSEPEDTLANLHDLKHFLLHS